MIHSLFSIQDQNKDTNIQYPRENIQNIRKGVMVNGSVVYYGNGKKFLLVIIIIKIDFTLNITKHTNKQKTKYTYNFHTIVHNNQIKYINKEEKKLKKQLKKIIQI